MKKNNKGFSLVELIIVIAIMAILAGALAPALIKYINKSRMSTDISNAETLRTSIQTAMSDEDAMTALQNSYIKDAKTTVSTLETYGSFGTELKSILGNNVVKGKYYGKGSEFKVAIDVDDNTVIVYDFSGNQVLSQAGS